MASNRCTYQQTYNVSIPKQELMDFVIENDALSKKELRVCLYLFTILDGWAPPKNGRTKDPYNFKVVYNDVIGKDLNYSTKDVKKCIRNLIRFGILEEGDSNGTEDGLRFTF